MDFLRPLIKFILYGILWLLIFWITINISYPYIACWLEGVMQKIYTIIWFLATNLPYTLMSIRLIIIMIFIKLIAYVYDKFTGTSK